MNLKKQFEAELDAAREVVRQKERQLEQLRARPAGCVCDPKSWLHGNIDPVCSKYIEDDDWPRLCETCQHLKECHGKGGGE